MRSGSRRLIGRRVSLASKMGLFGRLFILPWEIGFVLFFLVPLLQSIQFSMSRVYMSPDGIVTDPMGLEHYRFAWFEQSDFTDNLQAAISSFAYSLPIILILSLILALILNQRFRGRLLARAIFVLPMIIATGVVIDILSTDVIASQLRAADGPDKTFMYNAVNFSQLLYRLGLPNYFISTIVQYINRIFDLVWSCGVQTILFIAGLQSIPEQLYEVSRVEGSTPWENFWFITFPMLSGVFILNIVYTTIDLFTNSINPVMKQAYDMIIKQNYDLSSAIMWIYFLIIGLIVAAMLFLFQMILQRRWD